MHQLMSKLSKPSKVASALDWKKAFGSTVLSLNFHQNRVGIAVASHPSTGVPCLELEPLRFDENHIAIDGKCLERFSNIVEEYKVCGVVVSWPLQHDTGRMGAACGRVIYALEQLYQKSNGKTKYEVLSRPFCLWDSGHIVPKQRKDPKKHVDGFGRCAEYGLEKQENESNRDEYSAIKERYHEDELTVVCGVWNDFCKEHWPELYATSFSEPDEIKSFKKKDFIQGQKQQIMERKTATSAANTVSSTTGSSMAYVPPSKRKAKSLIPLQ